VLAIVYLFLWQQIDPTQPGPINAPLLGDSWSLFVMLLKTFLMLGFVCLLAFFSLRYLPKLMGMPAENQLMKVVARYTLEPQKSLYVVEVAGKHLLLGVTQEKIELISELESTSIEKAMEVISLANTTKPSLGSSAIKEFSKYLRR